MGTPFVVADDTAEFAKDCFPGALTDPMSFTMKGSAKFKVGGKVACLAGDEKTVVLACKYTTATFTIPGAGTVTIQSLVAPQQSQVATSNQTAALLASGKFIAKLQVSAPASVVTPAGVTQTDPLPLYTGEGEFKTSNQKAKTSK